MTKITPTSSCPQRRLKWTAQAYKMRTRGFTLIEAMLALVITGFALVAAIGVLPLSVNYTQQDAQHLQAIAAGQQYLDALELSIEGNGNIGLPSPPTIAVDLGQSSFGNKPLGSSGNFRMATNGCPLMAGSTLRYDCTVTISWTQDGAPKAVTLENYATQE